MQISRVTCKTGQIQFEATWWQIRSSKCAKNWMFMHHLHQVLMPTKNKERANIGLQKSLTDHPM